jgi:hypothetical protein
MTRVMDNPSRLVPKSVPTPLNEVRGVNVQGEASRQAKPGQGKTGRVNESDTADEAPTFLNH